MIRQQDPADLVNTFLETFEILGLFLLTAGIIYVPGRFLVVPALTRLLDRLEVDENFVLPLEKLLSAGFMVAAFFAAMNVSRLTRFLSATEAITAAATVALGFAAQDVLGNLVSGVFIVLDPKFHIGDWIQWKDKEGIVEDISFRVTRVHTFDNELITVPNSELTKNAIVNPVNKDRLRVRTQFGIGYEEDIDEAREILLEVARSDPGILDRPGPRVMLIELGDSAVGMETRFWIDQPARTNVVGVRSEYVQAVVERFEEEGIEMPYPTQSLTGSIEVADDHAPPPGDGNLS